VIGVERTRAACYNRFTAAKVRPYQAKRPVKPITAKTYHVNLAALFQFLIAEGILVTSPMANLRPPVARPDQIQPFTEDQQRALRAAARKTSYPLRDEVIVLFLLDTGCRASELCGLRRGDVNLSERCCVVHGKGNKHRKLFFGRETLRALWAYLRKEVREPEDPLFLSERGMGEGRQLSRSGLLQLIHRIGDIAGIQVRRCSPHTFRHTFAVSFLRAGGDVFTLKELLGHTALAMVNRYVALADADLEAQHRQFSPVDRLKK